MYQQRDFKLIPVMGPKAAILNAPIKKGCMYLCTDDDSKDIIYFDVSDEKRIVLSKKTEEFDPHAIFEDLLTHDQSIIGAINELYDNKVGYDDIPIIESTL